MRGLAPAAFASLLLTLTAFALESRAQSVAPAPAPAPAPASPALTAESGPEPAPADRRERAPAPDVAEDPTLRKSVAERRAGLVLGVAPGVGFAGASGYPNNTRLIGNPEFYSRSPLLVGNSTTYFLMGALNDYFSFGPMVNIATFESDKWKSTGIGIGFRAEVFPLVHLFPALADTSIYGQAGVGSTELQAKGAFPSADGTQSFAGIGLHHEFRFFRLLGGHVAGGPFAEYNAIFSTSAERHWASFGLRLAWYGGTVTADKR